MGQCLRTEKPFANVYRLLWTAQEHSKNALRSVLVPARRMPFLHFNRRSLTCQGLTWVFEIFTVVGQIIGWGEISMSEGATRDRVAICLFCNFWPVLLLKAARVEQSLTVQVCVMAVAVPPATLCFKLSSTAQSLHRHWTSWENDQQPLSSILIYSQSQKNFDLVQSGTTSFCKLSIPKISIFQLRSCLIREHICIYTFVYFGQPSLEFGLELGQERLAETSHCPK